MKDKQQYDVFLIGAGVMSSTLATLLKHVEPEWKIGIVERNGSFPQESSNPRNNAGTGHSGFCELNYDLDKAIKTCESFEKSKQFWSYLVKNKHIKSNFINQVPHISFVQGQVNVDALKRRWNEMRKICLFQDMQFSDDPAVLKSWIPLVMNKRDRSVPVAATRAMRGTDIDFGALTSELNFYLSMNGVDSVYHNDVFDIKRNKEDSNKWDVSMRDMVTQKKYTITTKHVFIGAGGNTLPLLEKSGIPESKGYGGFPVSGQFLICDNPEVVKQHHAKVYGKPEIDSPPMSQPHLDARTIGGEKVLLFGPFAAFSTKFLKHGHWTDFFKSLRLSNIFIIISAGLRNIGLSKYLFNEVRKTHKARFKDLLEYYPTAEMKDWKLITAGQRVQVIKKDNGIPTIEFGTEVVSSADGSLAALLGASPGASTSVSVMIDVLEKCFLKERYAPYVSCKLQEMVPSHGKILHKDVRLFDEIEDQTNEILE